MSNYYTGLRTANPMPNATFANPMPNANFAYPANPTGVSFAKAIQVMPLPYYGEFRFGKESDESLQHIIKGLNSAVTMLTEDSCQPNPVPPRTGSWCFPEVSYIPVPWLVPEPPCQPTLCFTPPAIETTKTVSERISNFFCR